MKSIPVLYAVIGIDTPNGEYLIKYDPVDLGDFRIKTEFTDFENYKKINPKTLSMIINSINEKYKDTKIYNRLLCSFVSAMNKVVGANVIQLVIDKEEYDKEALVVTEIACALNTISNEFKHKNKITIGCEEVFALCEQRVEDLWFRIENTIITWGTDMHWLLRQHGYVVIVDYIPIEGCEQLGLCWRKIRVADTKSNFEMIFVDSTPVRKP